MIQNVHEKKLQELNAMRRQFTKEQELAYEEALKGECLFLTGGPGTGKSFLTKALILGLECSGKSVLVMALTGIAAINVCGTTLHRALGLNKGEIIKENSLSIRAKKCPLLDSADVVVVDEISMVRMDLFEMLDKCIKSSEKRTGKTLQLIVVGDFFQLPPVMLPATKELLERYYNCSVGRGYCFLTKAWEMFGFRTIILKTCIRQKDSDFIHALNKLRVGDKRCVSYLNSLPRQDDNLPYLVSTNEMAESLNNRKFKELERHYKGNPFVSILKSEGVVTASDVVVPFELGLVHGVRVMTVINDSSGRFQNGSCGTVCGIYRTGEFCVVEIELDNGHLARVEPYTWKVTRSIVDEDGKIKQEECGSYTQLPLKLAYAITIHKSQGQTYDAVNIDPDCWEAAQLYVALSRVRTPSGVHLMSKIKGSNIIVDPLVIDFYDSLENKNACEIVKEELIKSSEENIDILETENQKGVDKITSDKKDKQTRVGRPSAFAEGTKRIRVGVNMADYIQNICKKQAMEGGQIRLIPDELDICLSDALENHVDVTKVTFMAVPLELEGMFRREIKKYEKK